MFTENLSKYEKYMYSIAKRLLDLKEYFKYNEISNIFYYLYRIQSSKHVGLTVSGIDSLLQEFVVKFDEAITKYENLSSKNHSNEILLHNLIASLSRIMVF